MPFFVSLERKDLLLLARLGVIILTRDLVSYLPAIGRFLIVVTFLEDALRIITQWSDQLVFLHDYRHSTYLSSIRFHTFVVPV